MYGIKLPLPQAVTNEVETELIKCAPAPATVWPRGEMAPQSGHRPVRVEEQVHMMLTTSLLVQPFLFSESYWKL